MRKKKGGRMARQLVRGILGIVLAAAATWLADKLVDQIFGPEDADEDEFEYA
jgi:hypothetical protein